MSLLLYRVYPHRSGAPRGAPGHPLYVPSTQRAGRLDNPEHYGVFYASDAPAASVAERFGHRQEWIPEMFISPRGWPLYMVSVQISSARLLDFDDCRALGPRGLKPSDVATRRRKITQAWALRTFEERRWRGIRWWSYWEASWAAYGLWDVRGARIVHTEGLSLDHPAVLDAAEALGRPLAPGHRLSRR